MPLSIQIDDRPDFICKRNAMDVLAYGKDTAIEKRSPWQKFTDFIGSLFVVTDEHKIGELHKLVQVQKQPSKRTGADFVMELVKFGQALTNHNEKADFLNGVRLQVTQNQDKSADVTFYESTNLTEPPRTIHFEDGFVLPNQLFELESDSTFKLKADLANNGAQLDAYLNLLTLVKDDGRDQSIKLMNNLANAPTSNNFQVTVLSLEKLVAADQKERFKDEFRLQVTQENDASKVSVVLQGIPLIVSRFEGDVQLNDRLFEQDTDATSDVSTVFKTKLIPENLQPVVDRIVDPTLLNPLNQQYEDRMKGSVTEGIFTEMAANIGRSIKTLQAPSEKEVQTSVGTVSAKEVLTRLVLTHLTNATELVESIGAAEFKETFLTLSLEEQKNFLSNSDSSDALSLGEAEFRRAFLDFPANHQVLLKQLLFLLNPQLLVSVEMVKLYQSNLEKLSLEDQNRFLLKFSPIKFTGTTAQFKEKIDTFSSIEEKALFLISTEQSFKTPLNGCGAQITAEGGLRAQLSIDPDMSAYSVKILPAEVDHPQEVKIEMRSHHALKQSSDNDEFVGQVVAHQDVAVIYSVKFTESGKLEDANFELSSYKLEDLAIHDGNGDVPPDCKSSPIESQPVPLAENRERNGSQDAAIHAARYELNSFGQIHRDDMLAEHALML